MDANTVRMTAAVLSYLGLDEFYKQVDAHIEAYPGISYKDALTEVIQIHVDHMGHRL